MGRYFYIFSAYHQVVTLCRDMLTIKIYVCGSYAPSYCQYDRYCIDCAWIRRAFVGVALAAK